MPSPATIDDLVQLSTGQHGIRSLVRIDSKADSEDQDLLHIRASDASLDRDGEIVDPSGWLLDNYRRNPVIQNSHHYDDILHTIGRAELTEVRDGALIQTWRFASDVNPIARVARGLYRGGFLRSCSVGFIPIQWEYGTEQSGYRRKFVKQELIEVSAVAVPSNPNALVQAVKSGAVPVSDLRDLRDCLAMILDRAKQSTFSQAQDASVPLPCSTGTAGHLEQLARALRDLTDIARRAGPASFR